MSLSRHMANVVSEKHMKYVLRLKGEVTGHCFYDGDTVERYDTETHQYVYDTMNCEKFKYVHIFTRAEDADRERRAYTNKDNFEVVSYDKALEEKSNG